MVSFLSQTTLLQGFVIDFVCVSLLQVSRAHVDNDDVFLQEALARYKAFLIILVFSIREEVVVFVVYS